MTTPGLLLAFTEPGAGVPEAEFTDWYDTEHVPLRLPIPGFLSWTRYKAADNKSPSWAALYDLESPQTLLTPPYTALASTRSEREKRVLHDVDVVERRVYEAAGNDKLPAPSALYDPARPARYVYFSSVDIDPSDEAEFERWYAEVHAPVVSSLAGWVRTRRFVLKEWSRGGVKGSGSGSGDGDGDETAVRRFLAVHEYTHREGVEAEETREKFETEWTKKVMGEMFRGLQVRLFEFYKKWDRDG